MFKRKNYDRRNGAGGLGEGQRTVCKGGWLKFGDDYFYSPELERYAGRRAFVDCLEDAFSPKTASVMVEGVAGRIEVRNLYHLACKDQMPKHLKFLVPRFGALAKM